MSVRFGRVRIVLRAPQPLHGIRQFATGEHCRIVVYDDAGHEIELPARNVRLRIDMESEATAMFVAYPDEVDVEALARITIEDGPAPSVRAKAAATDAVLGRGDGAMTARIFELRERQLLLVGQGGETIVESRAPFFGESVQSFTDYLRVLIEALEGAGERVEAAASAKPLDPRGSVGVGGEDVIERKRQAPPPPPCGIWGPTQFHQCEEPMGHAMPHRARKLEWW